MTKKLSRILVPLFGILLFTVMLWVLYQELAPDESGKHGWHDIYPKIKATPWKQLGLALLFTLLSYALLPAYDFLGLRYVGRKVATGRVLLVSLLSYVFSNNVGLLGLSGGAVRVRHYTGRGLSAPEALKLTAFTTGTFWLGLLTVAGALFVAEPLPLPPPDSAIQSASVVGLLASPFGQGPLLAAPAPLLERTPPLVPIIVAAMRPLGAVFLGLVVLYVLACALRKIAGFLGKWKNSFPSLRLALAQLVVGAFDWLLTASALYVLIPEVNKHPVSFVSFFSIFVLAQIIGLLSHVPGGLGVFEAVMVLMLKSGHPSIRPEAAFGALVVFRVVYYLLPLVVGSAAMGAYELVVHRQRVQLVLHLLVPDVLAFLSFIGGIVLLFSGATPALRQLWWMGVLVPLPLIEVSAFAASLAGITLILLARGLQRRFDAAYYLTVGLLGAGVVASLYHGRDYEEACVLAVFLAALLPCRREFYRRTSLFGDRFTLTWISGVSIVLLTMLMLTLFAYHDQKSTRVTWWQFELSTSAPPLRGPGWPCASWG